jgi:hypothetical protein
MKPSFGFAKMCQTIQIPLFPDHAVAALARVAGQRDQRLERVKRVVQQGILLAHGGEDLGATAGVAHDRRHLALDKPDAFLYIIASRYAF